MVLVKMLMKIALPKMGELLVMMMTMISPSRREVPMVESLHQRAKVLLPKFRLEAAALRPERPLLIFFLGQNDLYTRRWAPNVGCVGHTPLVVICSCIFIYSKIVLHKFSAHLEICRIGNPDVAFSGPEF